MSCALTLSYLTSKYEMWQLSITTARALSSLLQKSDEKQKDKSNSTSSETEYVSSTEGVKNQRVHYFLSNARPSRKCRSSNNSRSSSCCLSENDNILIASPSTESQPTTTNNMENHSAGSDVVEQKQQQQQQQQLEVSKSKKRLRKVAFSEEY